MDGCGEGLLSLVVDGHWKKKVRAIRASQQSANMESLNHCRETAQYDSI